MTNIYKKAIIKPGENNSMILDLPDIEEEILRKQLPNVSVITITRNRGEFASIMLYNWVHIKYPRDKLEWIILDDSDKNYEYNLQDYIPQDDPQIRYIKLYKWHRIDQKRNMAVEMAKYDYIVHMDDDDYYFPDSLIAKIRIMLEYKVDGVHSLPIGVYDLIEKKSFIVDVKDAKSGSLAEATLAYTKGYWTKVKFHSTEKYGCAEGKFFAKKRYNRWVNLHFLFNTISITHNKNISTMRKYKKMSIDKSLVSTGNFEEIFPSDFKILLNNLRKILESKKL